MSMTHKEVSLTTAILICIIPVAIFWALVLIPGLAEAVGMLISLLTLVGWIAVIVINVMIVKEMSK